VNLNCSLVICCFNEEKHIGRLLHGFMQQTVRNVEVIIVDLGSTDETLSIGSRYLIKILTIKPVDFSFGRSLNVGCASTNKKFILIASAHVYPFYRDWLKQLLTPFESVKTGLVYSRQAGGTQTRISEHRIFPRWFPKERTLLHNHPFCNNANALIRKELWLKHPYDEQLTGLENTFLAYQRIKDGFGIAYQPGDVVAHMHNVRCSQIFDRYCRGATAFKQIFPDETFTASDFSRLFFSKLVSDYRYALKNNPSQPYWWDVPMFWLAQFSGTYLGFKQCAHISEQLKNTFYYPKDHKHHSPKAQVPQKREALEIDYEAQDRFYRGTD
jgi:rhamnosyltransferase